ncbi:MAG: winged helix-turn-helix domain-containing protein [Bacteroidales bacterium]
MNKISEKYSNIRPEYKIWLATEEGIGVLGDGKWKILKAIDQHGSLVAACENLGLTYRRTWNDLKKVEKLLGFALLEKSRGGQDGGHSVLTSDGTQLVKAFDHFHERMDSSMQKEFDQLLNDLR